MNFDMNQDAKFSLSETCHNPLKFFEKVFSGISYSVHFAFAHQILILECIKVEVP